MLLKFYKMKYCKTLYIICFTFFACTFFACTEDDGTNEVEDNAPISSVTVNAETLKIEIEETTQLSVTIRPSNTTETNINWSSSDETIATVDTDGLVTGISAGMVTIYATSADNPEIEDGFDLVVIGEDTNDIVSFDINGISGVIVNNQITVEFVLGTDVSNLTPSIMHTGVQISPNNDTAQDFTDSISYFVVAENGDVQEYNVSIAYTDETVEGSEFISTWSGTEFTIPVHDDYTYNYNIDVDNDGVVDIIGIEGDYTLTFDDEGPHTIRISGNFPGWTFRGHYSESQKFVSLDQWGTNEWISMEFSFAYLGNDFSYLATDIPNFSKLVSMRYMFQEYFSSTAPDASQWDVSNVRNFSNLFAYTSITLDTSNWDTGSVTNMSGMFFESSANIDTSNWDTSSVTNMSYMFELASSSMTINTSNWDTSSVTNMNGLFYDCSSLLVIDTSNWDTSSVTTMSGMFEVSSINVDTSNWDTSSVTNMSYMCGDSSVNIDTSNWDTSNVTNMSGMFAYNSSANPDTSNWDTSNVTNMNSMFSYAISANPNTTNWDTSNVTSMSSMFYEASSADPDVSNWDIGNVTNMSNMFTDSGLSTDSYDALLTNFASQSRQSDISFSAGTTQYCNADAARALLISSTNWTITDGGDICL